MRLTCRLPQRQRARCETPRQNQPANTAIAQADAAGTFCLCALRYICRERTFGSRVIPSYQFDAGVLIVVGRLYVKRQAASLLKFARATSNPELAAVLVQKAADLKAQAEPQPRTEDKSPVAPDVE